MEQRDHFPLDMDASKAAHALIRMNEYKAKSRALVERFDDGFTLDEWTERKSECPRGIYPKKCVIAWAEQTLHDVGRSIVTAFCAYRCGRAYAVQLYVKPFEDVDCFNVHLADVSAEMKSEDSRLRAYERGKEIQDLALIRYKSKVTDEGNLCIPSEVEGLLNVRTSGKLFERTTWRAHRAPTLKKNRMQSRDLQKYSGHFRSMAKATPEQWRIQLSAMSSRDNHGKAIGVTRIAGRGKDVKWQARCVHALTTVCDDHPCCTRLSTRWC